MKNIFVSSTFRDMQAERDLVQKEVLPQLRSMARKYGENINMIDLRWGVDTSELESEEGSMKVMSVCLDEVERSKPYMLIFLGERYGSIIDPKLTEKVIAQKNSNFKLDDYDISITAMEIEFGMLSQQFDSLENCVVCIRNFSPAVIADENERAVYSAEDEERAKKQQAFKERILEKVQGRVIEYTCDWDEQKKQLVNFKSLDGYTLCDRLLITYEIMFKEEWITYNRLSWEEKEQLAVNALVESKLRTFSGRKHLLEKYYDRAVNENGVLILQGEVGSGKTSIMCKLIERLEQNGKHVFRFVAGNSSMSETAMQLVQQMVYYLEEILDEPHYGEMLKVAEQTSSYQNWIERMEELAVKLNEGEKIYFIIDALDQMYQDESVKNLDFLILNSKLRYVLSATDQFEIASKYKAFNLVVEQIPPLNAEDAKEVMDGILHASSRNTYREMQSAILAKKSASSPLYISMLIQRLNMMGMEELYSAWTESEIISQVTETIANMPDDVKAAAVYLLEEAIVRLDSQSLNLREVVNLIGVSKDGLRENDIQVILTHLGYTASQLDISRLLHYLDTFFVIHEDGRIDFSHKIIREGIRADIDNEKYVKAIAGRVKELDSCDNFWKREGMYYARMTKDTKLAEEIIRYAYEQKEQLVQEAIKAEGLADEGDFYCESMMTCEGAIPFFANDFAMILDIRKEEAYLQEKIGKRLIEYLEDRCLNNPSLGVLRCLSVSCAGVSHTLLEQGNLEEALVYAKKELAAYKEIRRIEPCLKNLRGVSLGYEDVGHVLMKQEEVKAVKEALSYYEKALEIAKQVYEVSELQQSLYEVALAHYNMGRAFKNLGEFEDAKRHLKAALVIEEQEDDLNLEKMRTLAFVYANLGEVKRINRDSDFIDCLKKALELVQKIYKRNPTIQGLRDLASAYDDVSQGVLYQGEIEESMEYYKLVLETREAVYKACLNPRSLRELGVSYGIAGNLVSVREEWVNALGYYMTAKDILESYKTINPNLLDQGDLVAAYENIGYALKQLENIDGMLEYYDKSHELLEAIYGVSKSEQDLQHVISSYTYVGDFLSKKKAWRRATFYYEKAKENAEELCKESEDAKNLWYLSVGYDNLARVLRQRKKAEAFYYFKEATKVKQRIVDKNRNQQSLSELAISYNNVGHVLMEYGEKIDAIDYYKMALDVVVDNFTENQNQKTFQDFLNRYRKLHSALTEQGILVEAIDENAVYEETSFPKVLTWYSVITDGYLKLKK